MVKYMKVNLESRQSRFAQRVLKDFSGQLLRMLEKQALETISVQTICDCCNYPRSTFYNYFDDLYDLMNYCWLEVMNDMGINKYIHISEERDVVKIYSELYMYLDSYRNQIRKIISSNGLNGRCMLSLRHFMQLQIQQIMRTCPDVVKYPLREDVIVDYYTSILAMVLEKCFLDIHPLSKEEALRSVKFFIETIEKEVHTK